MAPENRKSGRKLSHAPFCWSVDAEVLQQEKDETPDLIRDICDPFHLSPGTLRQIMATLNRSMEEGLNGDPQAVVRMLPSYVRSVPNGTEKGLYLALDLGGTNFRVLLIRIEGAEAEVSGKTYRIPQEIMVGSGEALFDHIAECLSISIEEKNLRDRKLPLGFTFSFPCQQDGLAQGTLVSWTKGFRASGVENEDVVQLLKMALGKKANIDVDVIALLNDTTGTLMACAHQKNDCAVGIIVGTGSNACYIEKLDRCRKLNAELEDDGPDEIIINTEWGAFGDDGRLDFVKTPFDSTVDAHSINPRKQTFEKMISGMYLGELVRVIMEQMTKEGLLFEGEGSEELFTPGSFLTKYVSEIEADMQEEERTLQNTYDILDDLGLNCISPADCANVARVCAAVSARAADLCAAGVATILNRMRRPYVTVGFDGSVYRYHPTFKRRLEETIARLLDPGIEFELMLSEDGSGKGAALVAAVQCRIEDEKQRLRKPHDDEKQRLRKSQAKLQRQFQFDERPAEE